MKCYQWLKWPQTKALRIILNNIQSGRCNKSFTPTRLRAITSEIHITRCGVQNQRSLQKHPKRCSGSKVSPGLKRPRNTSSIIHHFLNDHAKLSRFKMGREGGDADLFSSSCSSTYGNSTPVMDITLSWHSSVSSSRAKEGKELVNESEVEKGMNEILSLSLETKRLK